MKKPEKKKLVKFLSAQIDTSQQVQVKGGNNGNPPDWDLEGNPPDWD